MHVFNTWLIANLVNPVVLGIWGLVYDHSKMDPNGGALHFFAVFLPFSIPSLFMSWFVIWLIIKLPFNHVIKFVIWLLLACVLPIINFFLVVSFLADEIEFTDELDLIISAILAVFLTVLIRMKYFFRYLDYKKVNSSLKENHS